MKPALLSIQKPIFFSLLALCLGTAKAQDKTGDLQTAIEIKQIVFEAQTVVPASGRTRQITGERYQVRVSGDTLVSDLPYFGRAYQAPLNGEGGIKFTTTTFNYTVKAKKKGWEISIRPKGSTDLREFLVFVSQNGYASLRALSNNRQPISFSGIVTAIK